MKRVLFLCTGNSARSVLAECVAGRLGAGRWQAESAGSAPKGAVHPAALELLRREGYDTAALRSKSWDEFASPETKPFDVVVTLCDSAAAESCPVWLGRGVRVHWGLPDPAAATAAEAPAAFRRTLAQLTSRLGKLVALGDGTFDDPDRARGCLEEIHRAACEEEAPR